VDYADIDEQMDERAAIYDRRIADRVAFKIDPVFQRFANAKPLRTMCVFSLLGVFLILDSRLFARASQRF